MDFGVSEFGERGWERCHFNEKQVELISETEKPKKNYVCRKLWKRQRHTMRS